MIFDSCQIMIIFLIFGLECITMLNTIIIILLSWIASNMILILSFLPKMYLIVESNLIPILCLDIWCKHKFCILISVFFTYKQLPTSLVDNTFMVVKYIYCLCIVAFKDSTWASNLNYINIKLCSSSLLFSRISFIL